MTAVEARQIEATRRRPAGSVPHPDVCPKVLLWGVPFALPPRHTTIRPAFGQDGVTMTVETSGECPEAEALVKLADVQEAGTCEACGRPLAADLRLDAEQHGKFLLAAFALAARLLDEGYKLDGEQKAALLTLCPDNLQWPADLLAWCYGTCPSPN